MNKLLIRSGTVITSQSMVQADIYVEDGKIRGTRGFCHLPHKYLPAPCLLYTSPSPRDRTRSRMPSSA